MSVSSSGAMQLEVAQRAVIARNVVENLFRHPEQASRAEISSGAHLLVQLSPESSRQYSLCNGPEERDILRIAVKLEADSRGGSAAMHQLEAGDCVLAEFPPNFFALEPGEHTVFYAAGIGITPIISMVQSLAAADKAYTLFYSAPDEDHAPYRDFLGLAPYASTYIFSSRHNTAESTQLPRCKACRASPSSTPADRRLS
jgi:vanillate O-demethylase ferredoxin subunit